MFRSAMALAALALMTACAQIPELDVAARQSAADAEPLPFLDTVEMAGLGAAETAPEDDTSLDARLERLRVRAAALRGPVFSGSDRARLTGAPG
ncbi:MAG: hypothetical protein AAFQ54_05945 [Pseudomonadota bacterium]